LQNSMGRNFTTSSDTFEENKNKVKNFDEPDE
jgi:hypothetical protein